MPDEDAMAFLPVSVSSGDDADPDDRGGALTLEIGEVRCLCRLLSMPTTLPGWLRRFGGHHDPAGRALSDLPGDAAC